jgi:heterodisulfide reductase subunit E
LSQVDEYIGVAAVLKPMAGRYLKDRAWLYAAFVVFIAVVSSIILLLPYETVYVRDRTYLRLFLGTIIVCLGVFFIGILYNVLTWMHGKGLTGAPEGRLLRTIARSLRAAFSRRLGRILSVFVKDAVYLSKLKERSVTRWSMHLLILGGFIATFVLDLVVTFSLDIVHYEPMLSNGGWAKVWIRDFAFDLAGLMMLAGLVIAAVRRFVVRPKIVRTELSDATSILFLLAVVLGGFILEGMGIAGSIPGHQADGTYSFVGYIFSKAMPATAGQYYDAAWLIHGLMSALLIAYIPFSKLFHMVATPIAIEAEAMLPHEVRA